MSFSAVLHERAAAPRILKYWIVLQKKTESFWGLKTYNTELFLALIFNQVYVGVLHLLVGDKSLQTPSKYQTSKHKLGLVRRDHHSEQRLCIIGITIGTDNKYLHSLWSLPGSRVFQFIRLERLAVCSYF